MMGQTQSKENDVFEGGASNRNPSQRVARHYLPRIDGEGPREHVFDPMVSRRSSKVK